MTPITAAELAQIVDGELISGDPGVQIRGLSIDSRAISEGDVFVAFDGAKVDGHQFVIPSLSKGASAALVTHDLSEVQVDISNAGHSDLSLSESATAVGTANLSMNGKALIRVQNSLDAVQRLAMYERSRFSGPVIGVTGSNGKTTTKDMLKTVFSTGGPCLATAGNLNTELGLPLTLLRRQGTETSIVLEMGMRGLGQIAELCRIGQPTVGIITNIGQSHLELLGSQERIAQAKGELLEALPSDGIAALTAGDPWLERIYTRCKGRVLWYGLSEQADAFAADLEPTSTGTRFHATVLGKSTVVELPTPGRHNVVNALGALLLGAVHDLSLDAMADALRNLPASVGRLRIFQGRDGRSVIDDCYNASPLSMKASLSVLMEQMEQAKGATSVAILGDMFELGDYEEAGHREVGRFCAEIGVTRLITVGERAKWIAKEAVAAGHPQVRHFATKQELLSELEGEGVVPTEATVLVKASRGMALEDIVAALEGQEP